MKRKDFLNSCASCGALSLLGLFQFGNVSAGENEEEKKDDDGEPMNKTQIRQLLKFIDTSVGEPDKKR
jgi:hypothetical protein